MVCPKLTEGMDVRVGGWSKEHFSNMTSSNSDTGANVRYHICLYSGPFLDPSRLPRSSRDARDILHDLGLWASKSSVCAFFTGGDSCCLELSWALFTFDEADLSRAGASSSLSSPTTSSMTTNGSAGDLVRSGVPSGDTQDSFNRGELHASGVPHPFCDVDIGVLAGFLKKG